MNTELNEAAEISSTDRFKLYLNSIFGKIDEKIHEELWDRLMDIILDNQKQVLTDEEIEKLAEKEYPLKRVYSNPKLNKGTSFSNEIQTLLRNTFIKGFKSALQYSAPSIETENNIKHLAIQFVLGDEPTDENWAKAIQFTNGDIVKMLKDFAIMYNQQLLKEKDEQIKELKGVLEALMKDSIGSNFLPKAPKTAIIKKAQYILQKHNAVTKQ